MIVLNLQLDKIFGFENFTINFTYPKKVINSLIETEHLEGRERFRYKKAVILMGANATGKTSLGKALLRIFSYINTGNTALLLEMVSGGTGSFTIDFVNKGYILHRLTATINTLDNEVNIAYFSAKIDKMDSYEKCLLKLKDGTELATKKPLALKNLVGCINYRFAYPEIQTTLTLNNIDKNIFLKTLRAILCTLDPTLEEIIISKDLKDTYIIRRKQAEIIIQEGKLLNRDILSSGTAEGIDVAIFLASMLSKEKTFYYCDEHFSYIQSDIEKRIFGLMLDRLTANEQLIFTTHNTDMLDLNLPKHTYIFLSKTIEAGHCKVNAISASAILKRNTDSLRHAVENNVFYSLPNDNLLDELEMGWENE